MVDIRLHCVLNACEMIRLIEKEGADVNRRDIDGATALHVARSSSVARVLIDYGAEVNTKNSRGMTPLHRARNYNVAKVLLENGAHVNATDDFGNTPLHSSNDNEVVKLLLKYSASVTRRNLKGETPIHTSTYGTKVLVLAKAGADIDAVDKMGRTLLMKKSRCIYMFRLLEALLSLNPSIFLKDSQGKTAIDFTIDDRVKRRLEKYRLQQNWRRRKALVVLKERSKHFVAKDNLVSAVISLPTGVFRVVVCYL